MGLDLFVTLPCENVFSDCVMFVQGFGFPVNRLFDLLFEVRDQYNETLLKKWALVFRWASLTCGVCHSRTCRNTNDNLTITTVFAVRLSAVTSPSVCSLHILFEQSRAAKNTQLKPESALFVLFQQSISTV